MKQLNKYIVERLHINKYTGNHYNYHPTSRTELRQLIYKLIKERGNDCDLNDIDTSEITNMVELFYNYEFNGDISNWNVSNVTDMSAIFCESKFTSENGDISNWDVSNVKTMTDMFYKSPLEKNPPKWYKK